MRRLILVVLIINMLLFDACSVPPTSPVAPTPTPAPAPIPAPTTAPYPDTRVNTVDEACSAVDTYLHSLAKISEAKSLLAKYRENMWSPNSCVVVVDDSQRRKLVHGEWEYEGWNVRQYMVQHIFDSEFEPGSEVLTRILKEEECISGCGPDDEATYPVTWMVDTYTGTVSPGNSNATRILAELSAPTRAPAPAPAPAPPQYHTLSFTLEGEEDYTFPIYLLNNETLHLLWRVEDGETKVWFHILTPSGKVLGFYEDDGSYADGTLEDYSTRGMVGGVTQFSPSDYDWGEGYYTMITNKYSDEPVTVKVEYWIDEEATPVPESTSTPARVPIPGLSPIPVSLPVPPRHFPFTKSFTISPFDEETMDKYTGWFISQYPFNAFGVYANRLSFEENEVLDIVITSDQPISIEKCNEYRGGIYIDIQYEVSETQTRASRSWYELCDVHRSGNVWEARITFKPDMTGVYLVSFGNRSDKHTWCQYTISLHLPSSATEKTLLNNNKDIENEVTAAVLDHLSSLAATADAKQLLAEFQENASDTRFGVIDSEGIGHSIENYQGQDIDAYAIEFVFLDGENLHGVLGDEIIEMHGENAVHYRFCNWLVELDSTVQPLNNNAHRVEFELMPSNSLVWTYPELHQLHQFGISAEPDFFHQTVPRETLENPEWEPKELEETVIKLAREYEKANPYVEPNHVCRHMAVELWQVLKDNNITNMIVVGNTEDQEEWSIIYASDHAWLVVLGRNNLNLGVECTSGIVYSPSYMRAYEIDCELAYREHGPSSPQWETAKARHDRQYAEYEQHLEGYYHRSPVNLLTSALLFFIP